MAFLSIYDEDFWGRDVGHLEFVDTAGASRGMSMSRFAFGKPGDDHFPTMTALRMEPGFMLPCHAHDCFRLEIIVQGSLETEGRILKPGSIMISEPGELYGPHIAGPEGCTTMEIFSTNKEEFNLILEDSSGSVKYDIRNPDHAKKIAENLKEQMARRPAPAAAISD